MSTKAPSLKSTKEYRLFHSDETNRSPRKLKKIMASMKQWGFLPAHPLAVVSKGAKMIIKDGQHRFECAKALGIPVFYVVSSDYGDVSIPELNGAVAGAWNPMDYVQSYCNQGKPEYAKLRTFCEDHGIPVSIAVRLLCGNGNGDAMAKLRAGQFFVRDGDFASKVVGVILAAKPHFKYYTHNLFIQAIVSAIRVEGVSASALADKMSKNPQLLRHGGNVEGFLDVLEEIYNHHSKARIALKFMAIEGARNRMLKTVQ